MYFNFPSPEESQSSDNQSFKKSSHHFPKIIFQPSTGIDSPLPNDFTLSDQTTINKDASSLNSSNKAKPYAHDKMSNRFGNSHSNTTQLNLNSDSIQIINKKRETSKEASDPRVYNKNENLLDVPKSAENLQSKSKSLFSTLTTKEDDLKEENQYKKVDQINDNRSESFEDSFSLTEFFNIKSCENSELFQVEQLFSDCLKISNSDSKQSFSSITNNSDCARRTSNETSTLKFDIPFRNNRSDIKRPCFQFDNNGADSQQIQDHSLFKFNQDFIQPDWDIPRSNISHTRLNFIGDQFENDIWEGNGASRLEISYGQYKKPKELAIDFNEELRQGSQGEMAYSSQLNSFAPFKKLRFQIEKQKCIKHYEFNCYDDRDLKVSDEFKQYLVNNSIDNDADTDDETMEHYKKVCFSDLIKAIDIQKKEELEKDPLKQQPTDSQYLWKYYENPKQQMSVHFEE